MKYFTVSTPKMFSMALIGCLLISCLSLKGLQAKKEQVLLLSDISESGHTWHTDDVSVTYRVKKDGAQLVMQGEVNLTGKVSGYQVVDSFRLDVYFVNDQLHILGKHRLKNAPRGKSPETWRFERKMMMPENAHAIAFGYSGAVRDSGIDNASWDFWHTPY